MAYGGRYAGGEGQFIAIESCDGCGLLVVE